MSKDKKAPEKVDLKSLDISTDNRATLKQLFPSVFTETQDEKGELVESIDFEKLKAELGTFSDVFESRRERYGMDWPGKKDCMKLIQKPSIATLKPCREESVNFNETENLFIEGDNLEVLKLLQKSYYGKIKMIYIDPPYNTGKEFIYPDDYTESLDTYRKYAGLLKDDGRIKDTISANTKDKPHYHTKWLNMMYPRLYLARNLLREDGIIFISIDDNEVTNLKKLCELVFGEENFVALLPTIMNLKGNNDEFAFAGTHEYTLCFAKSKVNSVFYEFPLDDSELEEWEEDEYGVFKKGANLKATGGNAPREKRPNLFYPIYISNNLQISPKRKAKKDIELFPITDGKEMSWRWSKEKMFAQSYDVIVEQSDRGISLFKKQRPSLGDLPSKKPKTTFYKPEYSSGNGTATIKELFGEKLFENPKPLQLMMDLVILSSGSDDIICDLVAGSCTTAHAVLNLNRDEMRNCKFVMIQLPEPCEENSLAFKCGYKTIANVGKERIRRVIKKIEKERKERADDVEGDLLKSNEEQPKLDLGFKVFKLDKSNFKVWDGSKSEPTEKEIAEQLEAFIEHIDPKATQEDILYELLLKACFKPTEKREKKEFAGKTVFSIADGLLLICLEDEITKELIDAIADAEPLQFICLDRGFKGNDQLKANAVQTFAARNQGRDKSDQIVFRTV